VSVCALIAVQVSSLPQFHVPYRQCADLQGAGDIYTYTLSYTCCDSASCLGHKPAVHASDPQRNKSRSRATVREETDCTVRNSVVFCGRRFQDGARASICCQHSTWGPLGVLRLPSSLYGVHVHESRWGTVHLGQGPLGGMRSMPPSSAGYLRC